MSRRKVLVKRLVCIEDLGNVDVLFTDKTGRSPAATGDPAALARFTRLGVLPFDHERNMVSVLVRDTANQMTLVTKGAPETVLQRCVGVPPAAWDALAAEFAAGNRVVAVATRSATDARPPTAEDERGLRAGSSPPWPAWSSATSF